MKKEQWDKDSISRFLKSWAPSTWVNYNRYFKQFQDFAWLSGVDPSKADGAVVSSFLVKLAKTSERPKGALSSTLAALSSFFGAINRKSDNPINEDVYRLIDGLVKCETTKPLRRTPVMPNEPFKTLFLGWEDNQFLDLRRLRLKALTLLGLSVMLRPSDVAPKSIHAEDEHFSPNEFTRQNIEFRKDDMVLYLFGIKNDYKRDGFRVVLPRLENTKLCPVDALETYIIRTDSKVKAKNAAVFLSLMKPYQGLSASGVAAILNKAIDMAGLSGKGYSAKCFRPTGATTAVEAGLSPDTIRAVGRWKNAETFEKHYVHSAPAAHFTSKILGFNVS